MTPRSIQYILRSLAETGPPISDAELLRNFLAKDEAAFAELVRRHGRLVWAVCRHLTRSDAEADDAFQATFLVLLQNAKKVREAGKLSSWLHGVAYKVCGKARRTAQRREAREHRTAAREGNGSAIPDSAWDRALAAVHEEVAKLPETLRVPFVLCCLEGICVTDAAERLGWKLGTLSGRLTRAKDAVLLKLEARGLTLGVAASVGVVTVPTAVAAKASALAQVGFAIPGSILQLSQGVIGMSLKPVKLLAAAVILTCGLGLSVGTGWVTNAEAQTGSAGATPAKPKADPAADVKRLQAELDKAKAAAELDATAKAEQEVHEFLQKEIATITYANETTPVAFKTAKWEYDLVDIATTFDKAKFGAFLQEREAKGWEFLGSTTLGKSGGVFQWLFRRPVKGSVSGTSFTPNSTWEYKVPKLAEYGLYGQATKKFEPALPPKFEDAQTIEAEIAKLTKRLAELKTKPGRVVFMKDALPVDPTDFAAILQKMAEKKFGKGKVGISSSENGVAVYGDKDAIEWATSVVKSLGGK